MVAPPATASLTEELRTHDRMAHRLPDDVRAAIDAFDPERRGRLVRHAVRHHRRADRRPAGHRRPARGVPRPRGQDARRRRSGTPPGSSGRRTASSTLDDDAALDAATARAGRASSARCGPATPATASTAAATSCAGCATPPTGPRRAAFFRPRCDRVRVMPFLEGVPCSIHGFVLPDGTAALRPVEIVMLRDPAARTFAYSGLGTTWDPPAADREAMRDAARRVGAHLQREHGYRGAFGIDGVLTADGFRPTELNTRMSAGATTVARGGPAVLHVPAGRAGRRRRHRATAADVEALVPAMDAHRDRQGRSASARGTTRRRATTPTRSPGTAPRSPGPPSETGNVLLDRPPPRAGCSPRSTRAPRSCPGSGWRRSTPRWWRYVDATYGAGLRRASSPHPTSRAGCRHGAGRGGRRRLRRPRRGGPAGQARPRRHPARAARHARRRGVDRSPRTASSGTPGRRRRCCPAVVRDLFRKSGRPVERELELEPLDLVREHWFEDGTVLGLPGHSRAAQLRAVRRARRRGWAGGGSTTSTRSPTTGRCCAARYFENALGPRRPAPRGGRAARQPRDAAQAAEEDVQGRAAAAGRRRTRSSPRGTTCATCPAWAGLVAYLEQRFGAWTVAGGMAPARRRRSPTGWRPAG